MSPGMYLTQRFIRLGLACFLFGERGSKKVRFPNHLQTDAVSNSIKA